MKTVALIPIKLNSQRFPHKNMTNKVMVCLMMLPGLLYLLINNYLPMYGITMAFREPDFSLDNVLNSPINGFENFKFLCYLI